MTFEWHDSGFCFCVCECIKMWEGTEEQEWWHAEAEWWVHDSASHSPFYFCAFEKFSEHFFFLNT